MLEPHIHDLVKKDVREERRNYPALPGTVRTSLSLTFGRRAGLGVRHCPRFQHSRVQPLADQSEQYAVTYPLVEDVPELRVVDAGRYVARRWSGVNAPGCRRICGCRPPRPTRPTCP
jgi:hypothetical protein